MKNKETIIFLTNQLGNDGFTRRTFDLYNYLAKEYNIIFLYGNLKLNLNDFLTLEAKKNTIIKYGFHENYWLNKLIQDFEDFDLVKNEKIISDFDIEEARFFKKIIKEHNVSKLFWYAKNDTNKPFYIKKLVPEIQIFPVIDYCNDDEYEDWSNILNEQAKHVFFRFPQIEHMISSKNKSYLPITFNVEEFIKNRSGNIWDRDQEIMSSNNLKIGFLNYYDHNKNGLWGLLEMHSKLNERKFVHDFVILGRSPLFWHNYEIDFLNANEDYIADNTIFIGWRDKVIPYLEKMDIVVSNTSFDDNKFKLSQTLLEAICFGKCVITTNYYEYENLKVYGVKYCNFEKLHDFIIENKDELISTKTDSEKFKTDMLDNDQKFVEILRKRSN